MKVLIACEFSGTVRRALPLRWPTNGRLDSQLETCYAVRKDAHPNELTSNNNES